MKKIMILTFVCLYVQAIWSANAFVWKNENPMFYFTDPETGYMVGGNYSITQALDSCNVSYETGSNLPLDLSGFDLCPFFRQLPE